MNREWTPALTAALSGLIFPILGLLDFLFACFFGNRSTFSWVQLAVRARNPFVALSVAYSGGIFLVHCYCPAKGQALSNIANLCRCIVLLSPTISAHVAVGAGSGLNDEIDPSIAEPMNRILFAFALLGAVAVGMVAGFAVSQHLEPHT